MQTIATDVNAAVEILGRLVGFPSVSKLPNAPIANYCADLLSEAGAAVERDFHPDGERQNIYATFGPDVCGGVLLCGHMDVVPADPAGWTSDPFALVRRGDRFFGRGAVDMKGFLALVLASAAQFGAAARAGTLKRPVHIAFTFDEETGGYGAAQLVPFLERRKVKPAAAIVGEPTQMEPIVGHKSGMELTTQFKGRAGHASNPGAGVNAISAASRFVSFLDAMSKELETQGAASSPFVPPHATLNVGMIEGGEARNVIPDGCRIDWEVRTIPGEEAAFDLAHVKQFLNGLRNEMRARDATADIWFSQETSYPGMAVEKNSAALALVRRVWPEAGRETVVSFGTDGCQLQRAGISTVVMGPGNLTQAHQPDEFIALQDMHTGLAFMQRVLAHMCE